MNAIVTRNMSCLYRTAREQLDFKEREIVDLKKSKGVYSNGGHGGRGGATRAGGDRALPEESRRRHERVEPRQERERPEYRQERERPEYRRERERPEYRRERGRERSRERFEGGRGTTADNRPYQRSRSRSPVSRDYRGAGAPPRERDYEHQRRHY